MSDTPAKFDAARYLRNIKGNDYLDVKWRLLWLRTEHPDAVIETELVEHDRQQRWAMFRARVSLPGGATATGYGQEDAAGFAGNPGDYPEKAETKALGRALAALGFGTQFTGEGDDAPVERPEPSAAHAAFRKRLAPDIPLREGERTCARCATIFGPGQGHACKTARACPACGRQLTQGQQHACPTPQTEA